MGKSKRVKSIFQSKVFIFSLISSFILLISAEGVPSKVTLDSNDGFKPVVRVKERQEEVPPGQKERYERLIEEGKRLFLEEMDYEGAIEKFKEAKALAITRVQKADVFFYLSLAYYDNLEERGTEFNEAVRKLIELNYYRELDKLLCPPKYIELYEGIKKEYGVVRIQSKPAGADVYINDSLDSAGKTPLTTGCRAGSVKIRVKRGKKEKEEILRVIAGKETASSILALKGGVNLLLVLGGIALAGGAAAALLSKGGGGDGGEAPGTTTGSIQVNSTPQGAQVYLDGNDTGQTTNCTLTNVSAGTHQLKLVLEYFGEWEDNVSVNAGQITTVDAALAGYKYEFVTKWGSQGSGDGQLAGLFGMAADSNGYIYVSENVNNRIQKFTSNGNYVTKWGRGGNGDGQFYSPEGIAVDSSGYVYVGDTGNHRVQKFTSDGTFVTKWGSLGSGDGQFNYPAGIAVDSFGNVFVADTDNHRIQKFTSIGSFLTKWGSPGNGDGQFTYPYYVAVDGSGNVFVADSLNRRIQKFTSDGTFITKWGSQGSGDGQFNFPEGVAVDSFGNVFVADSNNNRIQKFTSDGTFITKWGSYGVGDGQFKGPTGVAVDSSGYIYVADSYNYRIQKFRITTEIQVQVKITYSNILNKFNIFSRPTQIRKINRLNRDIGFKRNKTNKKRIR